MAICKECGKDFKHRAHGLCQKCYSAKYRAEHREKISQYQTEHREKRLQYGAKYRAEHREEILQQQKEYRVEHREEGLQYATKRRAAHGGRPASENKQCSAFLGIHVAEQVLSKVFKNVEQMPPNNIGYDFICNKGKKIDVKSACTRINKPDNPGWHFSIKRNRIADFFLCLTFDNREDLNPLHVWLIPGHIINHLIGTSISKSTLSKWDEYKLDINKVTACCNNMKHGKLK